MAAQTHAVFSKLAYKHVLHVTNIDTSSEIDMSAVFEVARVISIKTQIQHMQRCGDEGYEGMR